MSRLRPCYATIAALLAGVLLHAQGTPPAAPLVLLSREGRRPLPTTIQNGREVIALSDLAALFQATVREEPLTGGVSLAYKGRTAMVSADQAMASVNGRLVALPTPAVRSGGRWLVPVEFVGRAFALIYDQRIELRAASRLLIVGDLRVPRVSVRIEAAGPPTRIAIDISPPLAATTIQEPTRILVQVEADAIDLDLPDGGSGLVEQIRTADQPTTLAVLLRAPAAVSTTTARTATATRLTIEVKPVGSVETAPPSESAPPPLDPAVPIVPSRPALETIVIDPGHGGDDPGVRGSGGTQEKTITLDVARRIKGLIEARLGIRVILTREEDRTIGIDERAAVANNSKADLFVSLHANAALAQSVAGAEVFYLSLDPEMEAARREAQAASVTLTVLGGGLRTIDVIRWDMAQAGHLSASAEVAGILEEELRRRVPIGPRPRQRAPIRVLVGVNMPAVLVEMAYLSNPAQERRAAAAEFQTAVSQAVYEMVMRYRARLEQGR